MKRIVRRAGAFGPAGLVLMLIAVGTVAYADERSALITAAKNSDRVALRALIEKNVDVNVAEGDGSTALIWASHRDDLESADLLIRAGANVNAANDLGVTALWPASLNGNAAIVQTLMAAGANPNAALLLGETPLMTAARAGHVEVVRLLLAAGAHPNARPARKETTPCLFDRSRTCSTQAGGQTALMWAVAHKHGDVVAMLLANGADVHAKSDVYALKKAGDVPHPIPENQRAFPHGGDTALMFAARAGDLRSASLLVASGANVNDTDAWGMSAVAMAAYNNRIDVAEFLLERGADPNLASSEIGPLHAAILHRNEKLVAALLASGADPNTPLRAWTGFERGSRDRWIHLATVGATPIWLAARFGTPGMMRQLLERGADPLFVHRSAYYSPRIGSVRGADVGLDAPRLTETSTILMAAVGMGGPAGARWAQANPKTREAEALEAVTLAVELGIDVNAVNRFGRTCKVPWEVPAGQVRKCVEVANPDDEYYGRFSPPRTALEAAKALKYDSIVAFLIEQGAR
jgi:ankyrin repeat protein